MQKLCTGILNICNSFEFDTFTLQDAVHPFTVIFSAFSTFLQISVAQASSLYFLGVYWEQEDPETP